MKKKVNISRPLLLVFMFVILELSLFFFYKDMKPTKNFIYYTSGVLVLIYLLNILLIKISPKADRYLNLIVSMLFSIGAFEILRLDEASGFRQIIWISIGIVVFYLAIFIMTAMKNKFDKMFFLVLALIYILFIMTLVLGKTKYGARNWIRIGKIRFQPGEFIKILYIFLQAIYYKNYKRYASIKFGPEIFTLISYSFIMFFFLQKDLGSAVIIYGMMMFSEFVFEKKKYIKYVNLALAVVMSVVSYYLFSHVRIRVLSFINPWDYMDGIGLQITQSLFAISSGGFIGTGIGLGLPNTIPVATSDFIFAAICEEMGTLVGIGIIMLFIMLISRMFKISLKSNDTFYKALSFNSAVLFSIQSLLILGGVLKIIPLTGVTLPFVAYGGTSILASFIVLAMVQFSSIEGEVDG